MKYNKLILKNILRNKRRTLLTVSSLAVSLFLVITLATILTEFSRGSEESNPLRLVTRHAMSLGSSIPMAYKDRIASVTGVKQVTTFQWFGGIYKDERNFFANFSVDAPILQSYLSEVKMPDADWQAFVADRQGAIVGEKLVKLYGFTPGQRITLKSPIYRIDLEFIVRGIYTGGDAKTLFFHHEYFNEAAPAWAKDRVGTFGITANSAEDVPRIARAVDSMFINTDAPTKTESERDFAISFETMMGGVKQFMYGIMAAITFSILLVMGNTMAMSVRERTREVGTLKALGFQRKTIAWMFVGESLLLAVVGSVIGIGGAVLVFRSFDVSLYIPNLQSFVPETRTLAATFVVAVLVGAVSVMYSALRVSGITIAQALRSTE
jgi:putative ABC transport system permease protein